MWTIEQLVTFKMSAELQNFSRVADKLDISAAAVGKQIKTLEDDLGIQLFYRTTRRIELTDAGAAFYERAKTILAEIDVTNDLLANQRGVATGNLKVICSVFYGEQKICPIIPKFLKTYPHLTLDIELADRLPDLEAEQIDVSVGLIGGILAEHYVRRKIDEDRNILCATSAYLKKHGMPKKVSDLARHTFIVHSKRYNPDQLTLGGETVHIQPVISTNSTNAMIQFCLQDMGITQVHGQTVKSYIKNHLLVEVLPACSEPLQPLYVHFKRAQYLQPKLRVFIDYLIQAFKSG